jgi:thiamine transporter ThiT
MKKTGKSWLFLILEVLFMLVVPCILVWIQYGDLTQRYKVSVTAIMLLILIFWVFKRIFLNRWIKTFDQKIINIETNALSLTDQTAIQSNKKAWRTYSLLQLLINSIIPLLVMVLAVITIKTVEEGLIKLFGCLMFCLISVFIGVLFRVCEIYSIKLTHEEN